MLRWIAIAFLMSFALGARAADDWIDDFPPVTAVAYAVTEQLKVDTVDWRFDMRGIALKDDDDLFSVYMVGTLVLLRKIMLYKYQDEQSLSPQREAKLKSLVAAYLEAELLIGQGVGHRRGYLTTAQRCRDIACYRQWFKTGVSNVAGAAYRRRILNRLFCGDRAAELDALAQSYGIRAPYLPSPANTLAMEPELVGVAPAGCSIYGGDADRNGLCDDWQDRSDTSGATVVMEKVRMAPSNGLVVTFAKDGGKPGANMCFRVWRSSKPTLDADEKPLWAGRGTTAGTPLQLVLAPDKVFRLDQTTAGPDTAKPWLIVEATGAASPQVTCGRSLPIAELSKDLTHHGIGLFGPYPDVGKAVFWTGIKALVLTSKPGESGFVILRRNVATGPSAFYATSPAPASEGTSTGKQPKFQPEDYRASIQGAFKDSCEERESFALIGTVHTHPSEWVEVPSNDNFSMDDFNGAIRMIHAPASDFGDGVVFPNVEKPAIFLIPMGTLRILMFIANTEDKRFEDDEKGSVSTLLSTRYGTYVDRQKEIGRYPESIRK